MPMETRPGTGNSRRLARRLSAIAGATGRFITGRPFPPIGHSDEETLRSSDEKDRFLASVSHELRTPLTAIIGMLDILIEERHHLRSAEFDEFLLATREQAYEMGRLVDDYVIAGRLTSSSLTLELGAVDLDEAIAAVIQGVDLVGDVRLHVANPLGPAVGDSLRVRQIVRNLIRNAVRYANSEVLVATTREPDLVRVEIRNDGPPVDAGVAAALFEPFVRSSRPGQPDSLGLGLTISRGLAQRMGGDLEYHRRKGWTVFSLSLPTRLEGGSISPQPAVVPAPRPGQPHHPDLGTGLALVTQPIIDLGTADIAGYEALARVIGDNGRVLHWPDAIVRHPADVLQCQAIERALTLSETTPAGHFLAVNVDPQFLTMDRVVAALLQHDDLSKIVIEVTSPHPHLEADGLATIGELRARGARIAIDNVGPTTEASGLRRLVPDFIKVEREIADDIDRRPEALNQLGLLQGVASELGAALIVAGVERITQLDALADARVSYAQGYLLGRPAPPFPAIHSTIRAQLASLGRRWTPGTTLADLVTSCDVVEGEPTGGPVAEILLQRDGSVRLKWGDHIISAPMRARASENGADVLRRAMARPPDLRFSPVVAVDATGGPVGYVAIDTLIEASFKPSDAD